MKKILIVGSSMLLASSVAVADGSLWEKKMEERHSKVQSAISSLEGDRMASSADPEAVMRANPPAAGGFTYETISDSERPARASDYVREFVGN